MKHHLRKVVRSSTNNTFCVYSILLVPSSQVQGGSLQLRIIERKKAAALQKKRQIQMAELLKQSSRGKRPSRQELTTEDAEQLTELRATRCSLSVV
jgi:hypothetical protein